MPRPKDCPHEAFDEDPRYRQCSREMVITAIYTIALFVVMYGTAAAISDPRFTSEADLILIWPEWFFWAGVVVPIIFMILPAVVVRYCFRSMSLEPDAPHPEEDAT